jgi:hypothetical protein
VPVIAPRTMETTEWAPETPGMSLVLNYPVVLAGERRLIVDDNQERLIATTVSSGMYFPEYRFIASG